MFEELLGWNSEHNLLYQGFQNTHFLRRKFFTLLYLTPKDKSVHMYKLLTEMPVQIEVNLS